MPFIHRYIVCFLFSLPLQLWAQNAEFHKTYGIDGYNAGSSIVAVKDNGFIIAGTVKGYWGNTDIYLAKIDSTGQLIWDTQLGSSEIEMISDMKLSEDSTLFITGYTNNNTISDYNVLVMAIDINGTLKWSKQYGDNEWDMGNSLAINNTSKTLYIAGQTFGAYNATGSSMYLLKLNFKGDTIFTRKIGVAGNNCANDVNILPNGYLMLSGYNDIQSKDTTSAALVLVDSSGSYIWTKTIGNAFNNAFHKSVLSKNNIMYHGGYTELPGKTGHFAFMAKTTLNGDVYWASSFENCDEITDIELLPLDSFAILGNTTRFGGGASDVFIASFDTYAAYKRGSSYGVLKNETAYDFCRTSAGGYICVGSTNSYGQGITNIYVVKTGYQISKANGTPPHILSIKKQIRPSTLEVYPNPAVDIVFIKSSSDYPIKQATLSDIQGKVIKTITFSTSDTFHMINMSDAETGTYLLTTYSEYDIYTSLIVKGKK